MVEPGRKFVKGSSKYRFGFGSKEKDNEMYGEGNAYDYGARIYDPRLGKWLSTDPLQQKYADLSPYNYCANSPISAKDPDGKVIIFINGLYTPGTSVGQPLEPYWNVSDNNWIKKAQDRIGDHAQPRFYDGSMGGTFSLFKDKSGTNPMFESNRIAAGKAAGYKDAAVIIGNLKSGETIKIVTNSMGAAFSRGFTQGILNYQAEENKKISQSNGAIDMRLSPLTAQRDEINTFLSAADKAVMKVGNRVELTNQLTDINSKISYLQSQKKELLNVQFESGTDLSSHQVDYADPNVQNSYYMTTNNFSKLEKTFVSQKAISGATNLGTMSVHHSSGAIPASLPPSTTADPNPPKK
jgi:RHS repeat-associated protein